MRSGPGRSSQSRPLGQGKMAGFGILDFSETNLRDIPHFLTLPTPRLSNNNRHLMNICFVPHQQALPHLVLRGVLPRRCYYYVQFTDEQTRLKWYCLRKRCPEVLVMLSALSSMAATSHVRLSST